MLVYLAVLAIVGAAAFLSLVAPKNYNTVIAACSAILLALFMGLRDHVSGDYNMYYGFFKTYSSLPFVVAQSLIKTELGYAALNAVLGKLTGNFHLVLLTSAGIMLVGILRFAHTFNIDKALILYLATPYLLFVVGMGYTRQSVAIGFALIALTFLYEEKLAYFYILAVLATLFHYSAAAFLLAMWVNSWGRTILTAIVICGTLYFSQGSAAAEKVDIYNTGALNAAGVWFRLAILATSFVLVFVQLEVWKQHPALLKLVTRAGLLLFILSLVATRESVIVDRFSLYFFYIYLLSMGKALDFARPTSRWIVFVGLTLQTFGIFAIWFLTSSFAQYYWTPYRYAFY